MPTQVLSALWMPWQATKGAGTTSSGAAPLPNKERKLSNEISIQKKTTQEQFSFFFFFFSSWVCLWLIAGGSFSVPPPRHSLPQHTHALLQQQSSSSRLRKLNLISANHSSPAHLGSHLSLSSDFNNDTVPPQKEEDRAQIKRSCLAGSSITFFCPLIIFYIFFCRCCCHSCIFY